MHILSEDEAPSFYLINLTLHSTKANVLTNAQSSKNIIYMEHLKKVDIFVSQLVGFLISKYEAATKSII